MHHPELASPDMRTFPVGCILLSVSQAAVVIDLSTFLSLWACAAGQIALFFHLVYCSYICSTWCVCVRVCVRACVRVCVRACMCMRACLRTCAHIHTQPYQGVHAYTYARLPASSPDQHASCHSKDV